MHKLIVLLISIVTPLFIFAQPPGYLGKRASFTLAVSSLPVINGPTQNNRGRRAFEERKDGIGFNYEFEGDFSYVVGRYKSLGVKVGQYYTGALSSAYTRTVSAPEGNDYDIHELFNRVNVKSVGITYSKFKRGKGALAPIGNRFYWGLKQTYISAEILDKTTRYGGEGLGIVLGHRPIEVDQKTRLAFITMGWSNNQVFWDKLILKTGLRLSFPLKGSAYNYSDSIDGDDAYTNQENFERAMHARIMAHELFRVDVGVGYLLF